MEVPVFPCLNFFVVDPIVQRNLKAAFRSGDSLIRQRMPTVGGDEAPVRHLKDRAPRGQIDQFHSLLSAQRPSRAEPHAVAVQHFLENALRFADENGGRGLRRVELKRLKSIPGKMLYGKSKASPVLPHGVQGGRAIALCEDGPWNGRSAVAHAADQLVDRTERKRFDLVGVFDVVNFPKFLFFPPLDSSGFHDEGAAVVEQPSVLQARKRIGSDRIRHRIDPAAFDVDQGDGSEKSALHLPSATNTIM